MDVEVHRDLGRHEAEIESLQRELTAVHAELREVKECLQSIRETLSEAKGGWKTLMWLSGISATAGAIVFKLLSMAITMLPK
jgi:prefoldin subunit 5